MYLSVQFAVSRMGLQSAVLEVSCSFCVKRFIKSHFANSLANLTVFPCFYHHSCGPFTFYFIHFSWSSAWFRLISIQLSYCDSRLIQSSIYPNVLSEFLYLRFPCIKHAQNWSCPRRAPQNSRNIPEARRTKGSLGLGEFVLFYMRERLLDHI